VNSGAADPFAALPPDAAELAARWSEAAWNPAIDAELRAIYGVVATETETLRPVCNASGRCCRFEEYGHRLYVTGIEAAWCLRGSGMVPDAAAVRAAAMRGDCPFLDNGRCGVHAGAGSTSVTPVPLAGRKTSQNAPSPASAPSTTRMTSHTATGNGAPCWHTSRPERNCLESTLR
jgi:hypothetical protein